MPAHVTQISGDETWRGVQLEGHIDYVIQIRRVFNVDNTDRVLLDTGYWAGRVLNVEWVKDHPSRNGAPPMLELFCKEKAA